MMDLKTKGIKMLMLAGAMLCSQACSGSDNGGSTIEPPTGGIDETLDCRSPQDVGGYSTFFKPQTGWVGDPMPYYNEDDKTFYALYLQDWRDGRFNEHPIYYAKTTDWANFNGWREAIPAGNDEYDQDVFPGTGSFIKRDGVYYGFYTGHNGRLDPAEKILLATSTDFVTWTKQTGFEIEAPTDQGFYRNDWRDPEVYWDPYRETYVMLITTNIAGRGVLARYASNDLRDWWQIETLTEFESDAELIECPNIFEMGGKWYLVFSRINRDPHRKTFYRVADTPEGPWRTVRDDEGHHETFDGLFFYAGKTVSDGTNRYITGWCSSGDKIHSGNELPWAGAMITHKIVQTPTGRLYPQIVDAVDAKFSTPVEFKDILREGPVSGDGDRFVVGNGGKVVFNRNGENFKITMKIKAEDWANVFGIGFGACGDQSDATLLQFRLHADNEWGLPVISQYTDGEQRDFTPIVIPEDRTFDVTIVAEKTICITYINNEVAFTNRIYSLNQNPWMIYSVSRDVEFSDIKVYR